MNLKMLSCGVLPLLLLTAAAPGQSRTTTIAARRAAKKPVASAKIPLAITSPLGKKMTLKFHDEFDAVKDKDGRPYIDRNKWQTTFWQGSSERTLWGNVERSTTPTKITMATAALCRKRTDR